MVTRNISIFFYRLKENLGSSLYIVKELLYSKISYLSNYKISVSIPISTSTWTYGLYDGD